MQSTLRELDPSPLGGSQILNRSTKGANDTSFNRLRRLGKVSSPNCRSDYPQEPRVLFLGYQIFPVDKDLIEAIPSSFI